MTVYEFMKNLDEYLPINIEKIIGDEIVNVTDGESTTLNDIIKHKDVREEVLDCINSECVKFDFVESVLYCTDVE